MSDNFSRLLALVCRPRSRGAHLFGWLRVSFGEMVTGGEAPQLLQQRGAEAQASIERSALVGADTGIGGDTLKARSVAFQAYVRD